MDLIPHEIKHTLVDKVANGYPLLAISLGVVNREFNEIVKLKYHPFVKAEFKNYNQIASELIKLGHYKLALYFIKRPHRSDHLGPVYTRLIESGSPKLLDQFIGSIFGRYLSGFHPLSDIKYISMANLKVLTKWFWRDNNKNISFDALKNIIRKGCNKAAEWALKETLKRVYDESLATTVLSRGNSKLIKRLIYTNYKLFTKSGTISAAVGGNCDREIFEILYGIGAPKDCHDVDNAVKSLKRAETLQAVIEMGDTLHDHTQEKILNTLNRDFINILLLNDQTYLTKVIDSKKVIDLIFNDNNLLLTLCGLIVRKNNLGYVIEKLDIKRIRVVFEILGKDYVKIFDKFKANSEFIYKMIKYESNSVYDPANSKVQLLYESGFTLPSNMFDLAIKYDNIVTACIWMKTSKVSPLRMVTLSPLGSKLRVWFADLCSKMTPITALCNYT
ncbi:hypothetical protein PRJ_Fausto_00146 [Faustovirus]|nr:hypothetical protein PRJ_Fausto_00146 [Faustovirus]QBR99059.1 hypothetical protein [Faustovirus mariensis]